MIVVGNKGMTGVRRLLGSLPNRVSHQAQCDVLIIPTQLPSLADFGRRPIVVGTDGSRGATRAVKEAIRLSKALDSELHVVSASDSADAVSSALEKATAQAADEGVSAITHPYDKDPAEALVDVAKDHGAAFIVVGSKGMRVGEREWFGNIPDKLSHNGALSVLIVFTGDATSDSDAMSGVAAGDAESPG
jgi:nucleotide-binding universal stress UspA family protein